MRLKTYFSVLILLTVFASCKKGGSKPNNPGSTLVLDATEQQKAVTDNAFTFKLFNGLAPVNSTDGNLFISPLSVSIAMAMTSNGANGQTLAAIDSTMNFNGFTQAELNSYYNKLITQLPKLDPNTTFDIANSIWYKQGFSVLPQFITTNSDYYKATVQSLDFSSPSAVNTINNWVSSNTNGKITSIVNSIPSNEVMYLINALYFKSTWKEKFNASDTKAAPFYVDASNQVQAPFMTGMIDMNSYTDANVTVVELPYSGDKFSMVIVEPHTDKTLADIMPGLDQSWKNWMTNLNSARGQVTLPKFTYNYSISLKDELTALGMGVAFSGGADFSKISNEKLEITDVEHKTYVAVDENGTEAAAVTSVGVGASAAPVYDYNINRPFIFAIRERNSGLILFAGIMNNPLITAN